MSDTSWRGACLTLGDSTIERNVRAEPIIHRSRDTGVSLETPRRAGHARRDFSMVVARGEHQKPNNYSGRNFVRSRCQGFGCRTKGKRFSNPLPNQSSETATSASILKTKITDEYIVTIKPGWS